MNKKKLKYLKPVLTSKKGAVLSSEIVIIILMALVIAAIIITFIVTFINDKDEEIAEDIHSSYSELDRSNDSSSDGDSNSDSSGENLYETIPAGGVYKSGDKIYNEGENFPEPKVGDIYSYGDYEYGYGIVKVSDVLGCPSGWITRDNFMSSLELDESIMEVVGWPKGINFWSAGVKNSNKTTYEEILPSIGDKAVTSIFCTFLGTKIETIPILPDTITNASLAFYYCVNLKAVDYIPNSIIYCSDMFSGCASLETINNIPSSAVYIDNMFYDCSSLKSLPTLGNNVLNMSSICHGCTSLQQIPEIPSSVVDMSFAFYNCTSLTTPPSYIPESVDNIESAFDSCINLSGTITIDANPSNYSYCFYGTKKPIIITGKSTMLNQLATWGSVTVKK